MPKHLARIVALLLIPCLAVGSVGAGSHPRPPSEFQLGRMAARQGGLPLQEFSAQALALPTTRSAKTAHDIIVVLRHENAIPAPSAQTIAVGIRVHGDLTFGMGFGQLFFELWREISAWVQSGKCAAIKQRWWGDRDIVEWPDVAWRNPESRQSFERDLLILATGTAQYKIAALRILRHLLTTKMIPDAELKALFPVVWNNLRALNKDSRREAQWLLVEFIGRRMVDPHFLEQASPHVLNVVGPNENANAVQALTYLIESGWVQGRQLSRTFDRALALSENHFWPMNPIFIDFLKICVSWVQGKVEDEHAIPGSTNILVQAIRRAHTRFPDADYPPYLLRALAEAGVKEAADVLHDTPADSQNGGPSGTNTTIGRAGGLGEIGTFISDIPPHIASLFNHREPNADRHLSNIKDDAANMRPASSGIDAMDVKRHLKQTLVVFNGRGMQELSLITADQLSPNDQARVRQSLLAWHDIGGSEFTRELVVGLMVSQGNIRKNYWQACRISLHEYLLAVCRNSDGVFLSIEGYFYSTPDNNTVQYMEISPPNISHERFKGVGPELLVAGLGHLIERPGLSPRKPLRLPEPEPLTERIVTALLGYEPKRVVDDNPEKPTILLTRSEIRKMIQKQHERAVTLVKKYGLDQSIELPAIHDLHGESSNVSDRWFADIINRFLDDIDLAVENTEAMISSPSVPIVPPPLKAESGAAPAALDISPTDDFWIQDKSGRGLDEALLKESEPRHWIDPRNQQLSVEEAQAAAPLMAPGQAGWDALAQAIRDTIPLVSSGFKDFIAKIPQFETSRDLVHNFIEFVSASNRDWIGEFFWFKSVSMIEVYEKVIQEWENPDAFVNESLQSMKRLKILMYVLALRWKSYPATAPERNKDSQLRSESA